MKLRRVVLASDAHPNYLPFWPLVARQWTRVGLIPTLALIGDSKVEVDERLGDVVRFDPLPDVPTWLHAQVIRLILPTLFPNDCSMLSDIDMIPLSGAYFHRSVADIGSDRFVVFNNGEYDASMVRYPMCYNAAKGTTFGEVFEVGSQRDFPAAIRAWATLGRGWDTDEEVLYSSLHAWKDVRERMLLLNRKVTGRVDRAGWHYSRKFVLSGKYIDAHLPRPYEAHRDAIDRLARYSRLSVRRRGPFRMT